MVFPWASTRVNGVSMLDGTSMVDNALGSAFLARSRKQQVIAGRCCNSKQAHTPLRKPFYLQGTYHYRAPTHSCSNDIFLVKSHSKTKKLDGTQQGKRISRGIPLRLSMKIALQGPKRARNAVPSELVHHQNCPKQCYLPTKKKIFFRERARNGGSQRIKKILKKKKKKNVLERAENCICSAFEAL